jgi:carboxypeptidase Taq
MSEAYRALEARFARMSHVGGALAMLQWDQQVMMPPGGNGVRAEQMATLRQIAHELLTSAETGDLLDEAEQDAAQLGPWQAANLREMRRSQRRATAMPTDLVAALTRAASAAEMTWRDARARADFALLRPALEEVVRLTREEAAAKAAALGRAPYDALLDGYEPGIGTAEIDALFEPLAAFLPEFLERVRRIRSSRCRSRGASPRPGRRRSAGG